MRKLSGLSAKLFLLIFTAAAAYITRFTFTGWDRAGFLYPLLSRAEQIAVIAAGVLLIAALCGIFLRFMTSASEKKRTVFHRPRIHNSFCRTAASDLQHWAKHLYVRSLPGI